MTEIVNTTDVACPDCGGTEAVVRINGNAMSSVCTGCRRADVGPILEGADLRMVHPNLGVEAELFELEAVRSGQASPLAQAFADVADGFAERLEVELRLPVPPR